MSSYPHRKTHCRRGHLRATHARANGSCTACDNRTSPFERKLPHGYVDTAPFTLVLGELYRRGETLSAMHRVTGLDPGTLKDVIFAERPRVQARTAVLLSNVVTLFPEGDPFVAVLA